MAERKIILITGGSRSGKSRMALELSRDAGRKIFVATAQAGDTEMKLRIERHRKERGAEWITIEEPIDLRCLLKKYPDGLLVVDCLGLWVSNLLLAGQDEAAIRRDTIDLSAIAQARNDQSIFVTNEVGSGIVPDNELARRFRDALGSVNQMFADVADEVILMISGLPLWLKRKGVQDESI